MPHYRVHAYDDEHYATLLIRAETPQQASRVAVQFVALMHLELCSNSVDEGSGGVPAVMFEGTRPSMPWSRIQLFVRCCQGSSFVEDTLLLLLQRATPRRDARDAMTDVLVRLAADAIEFDRLGASNQSRLAGKRLSILLDNVAGRVCVTLSC